MAGPWTKYQQGTQTGPWAKYAAGPAAPTMTEGVVPTEENLPGSTPLLRQLAPMAPPPTQFEQERPGAGMTLWQHVGDTISSAIHSMIPGGGGAASPYYNMAAPAGFPVRQVVESSNQQAAQELEKQRQFRQEQGYNPAYRALAEVTPVAGINVAGAEQAAAQGRTGAVIGDVAGPPAIMATLPLIAKGAGMAGRALSESIAPKIVRIEGVNMPVLAGEAVETPTTLGQKTQIGLKRAGVDPDAFTKVEAQQQAAVKQVIKNVAKRTTGLQSMTESPAGVMQEAAIASFEQAKPMYQALDASITHVPIVLDDLGNVAAQAIRRAKALDIPVGDTWNPSQPFQSLQVIRSELLDGARTFAESDPLKSARLYEEANKVDAAMSDTLQHSKIPGLYDNWRAANGLWRRGYALRAVGDAIGKSIEGTPAETQLRVPGEIEARLPEIDGNKLVKQLNQLEEHNILTKGVGSGYAQSVRQVAEFLKRAQSTNIGKRTMRVGGYSVESGLGHAKLDFLYHMGGRLFTGMMTNIEGAKLVADLSRAATPQAVAAVQTKIRNFEQAQLPSGQYEHPSGIVPPQRALPGQQALPPAGSVQRPGLPNRPALNPAPAGAPAEPVYEGEYVETPAPRNPKIARPVPPPPSSEPIPLGSPERPALPASRQKALPPARSTQLPNISDSTASLLSKTRGFRNVEDVMMAAKNGTITPTEAARITKLLKGRAAEITRPITRPEPPPKQGGHGQGMAISEEELARPGTNYVISKGNAVTYHGKQFAPEGIAPGAVHVTVLPDRTFRVNAGTLTEAQRLALEKALKR